MRRRLYALVTVRRQRRTTGGRRELVASTSTRRPDDLGRDDHYPCSDDLALIRGRGRHAAATPELASLRPGGEPRRDTAAVSRRTLDRDARLWRRWSSGSKGGCHRRAHAVGDGVLEANVPRRPMRRPAASASGGPRVSSRTGLFVIRDAPGPGSSTRIVDLSDAEARAPRSRQPPGRARGGMAKARANSARSSPRIRSSAFGFKKTRRVDELTAPPGAPLPPPPPGTALIRGTLRTGPELDADDRLLRPRSAYGPPRSRTSRNAEIRDGSR